MLVKLNDGESVTVMLNHIDEPHAFTLSNRGGTLTGREFHRPVEQEDLTATDSQQLKQAIALVREAGEKFIPLMESRYTMYSCLDAIEQRACV